jgi:hypothetical protein
MNSSTADMRTQSATGSRRNVLALPRLLLCAVAIPNGELPNGIPMGDAAGAGLVRPGLIALARRLDTKSRKQPHAK